MSQIIGQHNCYVVHWRLSLHDSPSWVFFFFGAQKITKRAMFSSHKTFWNTCWLLRCNLNLNVLNALTIFFNVVISSIMETFSKLVRRVRCPWRISFFPLEFQLKAVWSRLVYLPWLLLLESTSHCYSYKIYITQSWMSPSSAIKIL